MKLTGLKTYIAALGMALLGIADIIGGDTNNGILKIVQGLALAGIGHKIDRAE